VRGHDDGHIVHRLGLHEVAQLRDDDGWPFSFSVLSEKATSCAGQLRAIVKARLGALVKR